MWTKSVNLEKGKCELIANFTLTVVTSLPPPLSLSLSVCLKICLSPLWQHEASAVRDLRRFGPLAILQLLSFCLFACLSLSLALSDRTKYQALLRLIICWGFRVQFPGGAFPIFHFS